MIFTKKDGRTKRTGKDYTEFRQELYRRQRGHCKRCDRNTTLNAGILSDHAFHVHHEGGRGMGGSKRDDVFEKVEGLCGNCHLKEHGQR